MKSAHLMTAFALAGLAAACSSTRDTTTYYAPGAAPVAVAGSTATYSSGSGTVASGVNSFSAGDRIVAGDAATKTTSAPTAAAPAGSVVGGSVLNANPNAGVAMGAQPTQPEASKPESSR